MVADLPPYPEVVYITYSGIDEECRNFSFWLYQRLKYADLPVRIHGVDNGIGGSGFGGHSIDRAEPLIAVVSNMSEVNPYYGVFYDIEQASEKNKRVYLVIYEDVDIPVEFKDIKVFDFRISQDSVFDELKSDLLNHDYPKMHSSLGRYGYDNRFLNLARKYNEDNNIFMRDYYYMKIFDGRYSGFDKVEALYDIANLKILSGLVLAVLNGDSDEQVRAIASLAISKYKQSKHIPTLKRLINEDTSKQVRLYAQISLMEYSKQDYATKLSTELQNIFLREKNPDPLLEYIPKAHNNSYGEHKIFISYARKDAETYAIDLKNNLEKHNYPSWLDTNIPSGSPNWSREIEKAIQKCSIVLVLLSPEVHKSDWVKRG